MQLISSQQIAAFSSSNARVKLPGVAQVCDTVAQVVAETTVDALLSELRTYNAINAAIEEEADYSSPF